MATRYEILEPFGESPLGSLFKARDRELERLVLFRLLPSSLFRDDGERRECLRRAAAVAGLRHFCLLPLYEAGETAEGDLFQAFAWAEGETLARRLATGPLKPAVALDLTVQVAAALTLAQAHGILHGRLDPSSLLLTPSGEAKLLDLAVASLGERTLAEAEAAVETAWLAPEQRQGRLADARSDVWALGAMLYEMMTGRRPRHGTPEPLRTLLPEAPEELEKILAQALEPEPADRLASAEALTRALAPLARSGSPPPLATGPTLPPLPSWGAEIGGQIAHYRLLERLGGGGMGIVYRAEDTRLGRTVALKLLPPQMVRSRRAKLRFFQEARMASALEHPNLCTVYDAGEDEDGHLWLAMPCYDGETLLSRLERGPLPVDEAADVARQIALGLAKAHRQGIVHRDIKPANLMLTTDGVVKILDFGIAKLVGEEGITRTGAAIGTPAYMSPEQASGREVDHRTDLWSLGVVLYEMLTGRRPFPGDHGAVVIESILRREPEPVTKWRPEVPAELEAIVHGFLVKDPEGRSAAAGEVATGLRALQGPASGSGARPARVPLWRSFWRARGLLVLAVGVLAAWLLGPADWATSPGEAKFMRLTDQQGIEQFPSLSPAGDHFVYARRDGGDLDIFLQRVGGSQPINLTADSPSDDTEPAYSPDGRSIAFRSERQGGGLFLMGATGESVRRLVDFGHQPAWSPDGREIACSTVGVTDPLERPVMGEIRVIDLATGRFRLLVHEDAVQPSWSPDGSRIAYWGVDQGTGKRFIRTVSASGRNMVSLADDATHVDWGPIWSPEGDLYFSSNRSGSMNLWRIAVDPRTWRARGEPKPVPTPAHWAGFPSLSSDGRKMVYATRQKKVNLERLPLDPRLPQVAGEPVPVTRGTSVISYASVSPDGEWIVLSTGGGDREDLAVIHRDGGPLRWLMEDDFKDRVAVWAPQGNILFYSNRSGQYNAWSIQADGSGLRQLTEDEREPIYHPIPSPDGRRIAFCWGFNGSGLLDLTETPERRQIERLPRPPGGFFTPNSWSRDGERILGLVSNEVVSFSVSTRQYEQLCPGRLPIWMADGKRALFLDARGAIRMIDRGTREVRDLLPSPADGSFVTMFDLSPDDRWLYRLRGTEEGDLWLSY